MLADVDWDGGWFFTGMAAGVAVVAVVWVICNMIFGEPPLPRRLNGNWEEWPRSDTEWDIKTETELELTDGSTGGLRDDVP